MPESFPVHYGSDPSQPLEKVKRHHFIPTSTLLTLHRYMSKLSLCLRHPFSSLFSVCPLWFSVEGQCSSSTSLELFSCGISLCYFYHHCALLGFGVFQFWICFFVRYFIQFCVSKFVHFSLVALRASNNPIHICM